MLTCSGFIFLINENIFKLNVFKFFALVLNMVNINKHNPFSKV